MVHILLVSQFLIGIDSNMTVNDQMFGILQYSLVNRKLSYPRHVQGIPYVNNYLVLSNHGSKTIHPIYSTSVAF